MEIVKPTITVIGIDPGWASFGISIKHPDGSLDYENFVPKVFGTRAEFYQMLHEWILKRVDQFWCNPGKDTMVVFMERFVSYAGVQVSASEEILMLIGGLEHMFLEKGIKVNLVRALDWKVKTCHHLVRTKGFNNPFRNFDKKYSLHVAKELSGIEFESDHVADAVCLSYLTEEILCGHK